MARTPQEMLDRAMQTARKAAQNIENWTAYLSTMARTYKYSFLDSILIHDQRPDATACASMELWNNAMKRWVNKGSKAIFLLDYQPEAMGLRKVFDIADTNGRDMPALWRMKPEYEAQVIEELADHFGEIEQSGDFGSDLLRIAKNAASDNYQDYLRDLADAHGGSFLEDLDDHNLNVVFRDTLTASVSWCLLQRAGLSPKDYLSPDEFKHLFNFNTFEVITQLGSAARDISYLVLSEMERTVKDLGRQSRLAQRKQLAQNMQERINERSADDGEPDIHAGGGLSGTRSGTDVERGGEPEAPGTVRDAAGEVLAGTQERLLQRAADEGAVEEAPAGRGRAGRPDEGIPDGAVPEAIHSAPAGNDGVGPAHEPSPGYGARGHTERAGIQLSLFPTEEQQNQRDAGPISLRGPYPNTSVNQAGDEHSPAFLLSQLDIDYILLRGSGVRDGKTRIFQYYRNNDSQQGRAEFLKHEYGIGGGTENFQDGTSGGSWHDAKGIRITKGSYTHPDAEITLSWAKVQKRISELIEVGRYLPDAPIPEMMVEAPSPEVDTRQFAYKTGDIVYLENDHSYSIEESEQGFLWLRDLKYPIMARQIMVEDFEQLLIANPRNAENLARVDESEQSEPEPGQSVDTIDGEEYVLTPIQGQYENAKGQTENSEAQRVQGEVLRVQGETLLQGEILQVRKNFRITDDHLGEGGQKTKFNRNIEAIRLLKRIESENRLATADEQQNLSNYVGWGGLPQAFDQDNGLWKDEYAELKALLSEDEYTAARASTLNAHYTSPVVIKAIYQVLGNLGFKTGNILEPACGIGNFFGLLPENMSRSRLYGVELDSITGRIAKQLYQNASIAVRGFEIAEIPDCFFDAAIGNVPFGNYKLLDKRYDKQNFFIHDYFFAKALDKVRSGGIVAFITSKGTLDKQSTEVRKYIAQRAELLGAIRLPNTAFKANAGTEVTTDIIFLQKRDRIIDITPDWVHLGQTNDGIPVNSYFVENPHMILGTMAWDDSMYGNKNETACCAIEGTELAVQLQEAISHISGQISEIEMDTPQGVQGETLVLPASPDVRNFSFTVIDGAVYYRNDSVMVRKELTKTAEGRVKGLIGLRDHVRELMDMQLHDHPDEDITAAQRKLHKLYDAFTAQYGLINSRANASAFDADDGYFLLCSLEILNEDRNLEKKAEIFYKRTIRKHVPVTKVDTPSEALAVSLSEKACVDIPFMGQLTGILPEQIIEELKGVIFRNVGRYWDSEKADPYWSKYPGNKAAFIEREKPILEAVLGNDPNAHWVTADEYLSGNVRSKLKIAERFHEVTGLYLENVVALSAVQPKDLEAGEIDVRLGATWVPPEVIRKFIFELLDTPRYIQHNMKVHYSPHTAEWSIEGKNNDRYNNINAFEVYGTSRISAYKIIEESLNLRDVRIMDTVRDADGPERRVLNKTETMLAQQKQTQIKEAFKDWIFKDPNLREKLVRLYNDTFNSIRPREFSGEHLRFAGMNPELSLRPHQMNAIARILYGGNTLLAHTVGAGKTFEMIAAGMELKRLGLTSKSIYAVPNHLTEQWASEFLRLFPSANILVSTKKDFEARNRKKFCARIATGDYDAVILGHSQFEKIPVSHERQKRLLREEIEEITEGIDEVKRNRGERFTIKQLEKTKKTLETRLQKLNDSPKDDVVTFEELGVDRLFVDESHNFKNMFLYTKMRSVAGISQNEAKKSADLMMKCRYIDEITGSKGLIFASGTPVSNSMTELYTTQRYLQYEELKRRNLQHFDAWASNFGETKTAIELSPEGTGYRTKTRFSRFYNLPELMSMFRETADVQTADMLNLPVPKLKGGVVQNVAVPPTELQKEMVKGLAERAEKVRSRAVSPEQDNMLSITNDGRMLALDQRLMNPLLPDDPNSKVNTCVGNLHRIWKEGMDKKLTQLVFCDLSTPHYDGSFNVYDDIKKKLVALGVPEKEIAFIHDAKTEQQKDELFSKVRKGDVRILLGSTFKMGTGTNVQERLVALHHLDVPWRPADLEQRNGRILRQGNRNKEVEVFRYVTEGTFDAYSYQLIENKQKFISQVISSKSPVRGAEDVDEVALSYAEVKALAAGNPLIKQKIDLDVEVARLKLLKSAYISQRYRLEDNVTRIFPAQIKSEKEHIAGYVADIAHLTANTPLEGTRDEDKFRMTISAVTYSEKAKAGEALLASFNQVTEAGMPVHIGQYRGFDLWLRFDPFSREFQAELRNRLSHGATLGTDVFGNIQRLDNQLEGLADRHVRCTEKLHTIEQQCVNAKTELEKPFEFETELKEKTAKLAELDSLLNIDSKNETLFVEVEQEPEDNEEESSRPHNPALCLER